MMPSYSYRAYLGDNSDESGVIVALNKAEAARLLAQVGKRAFQLSETASSGNGKYIKRFSLTLSRPIDLGRFFSDISILLAAGFTADRALASMIAVESDISCRRQLGRVLELSNEGKSLAEAFSNLPAIGMDVRALIASGERSGRLGAVCQKLAENFEARRKRKEAVVNALAYPAFLLVVMAGALIVLATVLVPAFEPIFETASAERPLVLTLLSRFGATISAYPFLFPLAAFFGLALSLLISKSAPLRQAFCQISTSVPLVSSILCQLIAARYLTTLALLLGNGVSINEALALSSQVTKLKAVKVRFSKIEEKVASGSSLNEALSEDGIFDPSVVSLVAIGEEANALPIMLDRSATMLQSQATRRIDTIFNMLTPVLTIFLGILVGSLVVSVMSAILSINDLALR